MRSELLEEKTRAEKPRVNTICAVTASIGPINFNLVYLKNNLILFGEVHQD